MRILRQDARILERQTEQVQRFGGEAFASTEIDVLGLRIKKLLREAAAGRPVAMQDDAPDQNARLREFGVPCQAMGSGSNRDSTYLIKNAPSDRVDAPSPSDAPHSTPPDGRWRTSNPPPGESLESKWWPDRDLGKAFRRWTSIPPAGGQAARTLAIGFLVERLKVSEVTAVGTAPRTPAPVIEPPDLAARVQSMVTQLGMHGPNEDAPEHAALLAVGEEALPALRDLFPGRLWFNRWEPHVQPPRGRSVSGLCRTMVAFGEPAVPYVVQLLKSSDPEVLYYATLVAAELPHPLLVEPARSHPLRRGSGGVPKRALRTRELLGGRGRG